MFLLHFDFFQFPRVLIQLYVSMRKDMCYISFITWQKNYKIISMDEKFSVFTLGYVNTALNQSAFITHKCCIINCNKTFSRLLILILLQRKLSA